MSRPKDFTRWNRAGLSRFDYVDDNAATLLEALRLAMAEEFSKEGAPPGWLAADIPADETLKEKNLRLLAQYRDAPRDYAWEIMRTFSRSLHVTLAHLNAYANEGFIRTATQWENLGRLAAMAGTMPAPPASASTPLALMAKPEKSGIVPAGWQVKTAPVDGSPPVIFETLDPVEIHWELNRLYPKGRRENSTPLSGATFPLPDKATAPAAGTRGILLRGNPGDPDFAAIAVEIAGAAGNTLMLEGVNAPKSGPMDRMALLAAPRQIIALKTSGPGTLTIDRPAGLATGTVLAWQAGNTWQAGEVETADGDRITFKGGLRPPAKAVLHITAAAERQAAEFKGAVSEAIIVPPASQRLARTVWDENLTPAATAKETRGGRVIREKVSTGTARAYYLPDRAPVLARVKASAPGDGTLEFTGQVKGLARYQWLLCRGETQWHPVRIDRIDQGAKTTRITLDSSPDEKVLEVHVQFASDLRPRNHNINPDALKSGDDIALSSLPDRLGPGMRIAAVCGAAHHLATVTKINRNKNTITLDPPLPPADDSGGTPFIIGRTVIYANLVTAGHGETRPEKILGSGNAALSGQQFPLKAKEISFVPDPSMPPGVRADIEIKVNGRIWQQRPDLNASSPEDHHFRVVTGEQGEARILFGDGKNGRRLPTGTNNVRATVRTGNGPGGNLPPGALARAVTPHPLVEGFTQPAPASGGNRPPDAISLKAATGRWLVSMGRAVSLNDFSRLAAEHASVWQARAFRKAPGYGRKERIAVTLVPARGAPLTAGLKEQLTARLSRAALPGVSIEILGFRSLNPKISISIQVRETAFEPERVKSQVAAAVAEAFCLKNRALGTPFHRSDLFKIVEAVTGVENSLCTMGEVRDETGSSASISGMANYGRNGDGIKSLHPMADQVVYIKGTPDISVMATAYTG
ncbi:MAG: hypothetical protein HUN04_16535 [Desulfobacter sp.]|nr:MAG: hypothetical protein HUN04_16535 [Desulfobacter sp.]